MSNQQWVTMLANEMTACQGAQINSQTSSIELIAMQDACNNNGAIGDTIANLAADLDSKSEADIEFINDNQNDFIARERPT